MSAAWAADDRKLRELILYVAHRSKNDPYMGATKLNKVLFRADFGAYLDLGAPITGHPYFKLDNGPAPRHLIEIRNSLVEDGSAKMTREDVGADKPQMRLVPLREADTSLFSAEQLAYVDGVIEGMRSYTGTRASGETHLLIGWKVAKMRQTIPYHTAFVSAEVTEGAVKRAREIAHTRGLA